MQKYTHGNLSQRMLGPQGCPGIAHQPLGNSSCRSRHSPGSGVPAKPQAHAGTRCHLRSSPTFRISHSILVSSILLRPNGHSCLSSRLLFSSTICKRKERTGQKGQSVCGTCQKCWLCGNRDTEPLQITRLRLGAQTKNILHSYSQYTAPKTLTFSKSPKTSHSLRGYFARWFTLTQKCLWMESFSKQD